VRADLRHDDGVHGLIRKTVERFGRLDGAVNNAGTEVKPGPITEQTAESYAATFDTNVLGTIPYTVSASTARLQSDPSHVGLSGDQNTYGYTADSPGTHRAEAFTRAEGNRQYGSRAR
jgi:NAD(P)-dependent dehydrogenase (short-subunit alcohol dehydrogenase family)